MKASHNSSENDDLKRKVEHLKSMLEITQDINRLQEDNIKRLEHRLKDLARERFIFVN